MLKSRPEIAEASAKTHEFGSPGYLAGGSWHVVTNIVVALTPISLYAGKKGVDFLLQYLKDSLTVTELTQFRGGRLLQSE
jgi:hypothetical protein